MSCDVPYWGMRAGQSRPLIPSVKHHGDKSTALKGDMQESGDFFADWQSAENEEGTPRRRTAHPTNRGRAAERGEDCERTARGL